MLLLFNNVMENYMPTKLSILFNSVKTQLQLCFMCESGAVATEVLLYEVER
jgi:hypothetical protein